MLDYCIESDYEMITSSMGILELRTLWLGKIERHEPFQMGRANIL